MKLQDSIPVFYQGQPTNAEPDHYIDRAEMKRGLEAREYMSINNRKALLKLTTCLPKHRDHKDSIKAGWQGVSENSHSFKFRRDYRGWQVPLGVRVMELVPVIRRRKSGRMRIKERVSYSLTQCADTNDAARARIREAS